MSLHQDHALETYKSMISLSVEGFKSLLLINGGAVVAMLAYFGQASQGQLMAKHASLPLGFFVAGILFSLLAFAGSYWTQFLLFNEAVSVAPNGRHMIAVFATVLMAALSVTCFASGAFSSLHVLSRYGVGSSPMLPAAVHESSAGRH